MCDPQDRLREQLMVSTELRDDVKQCLDFMIRVNIEALGGPKKYVDPQKFLPPEVVTESARASSS